jgi:hypothetical protein
MSKQSDRIISSKIMKVVAGLSVQCFEFPDLPEITQGFGMLVSDLLIS